MAFYRHRRGREWVPGTAYPSLDADLITEIGTLLRVTDQHATELVEIGLALQRQLPATRKAFADGHIDLNGRLRTRLFCRTADDAVVSSLAEAPYTATVRWDGAAPDSKLRLRRINSSS